MADVATLGLAVDSGPVRGASNDLKGFALAAAGAEKGAKGTSASLKEMEARAKATSNSLGQHNTTLRATEQANLQAARAVAQMQAIFSRVSVAAVGATAIIGGFVLGFQKLSMAAMELADRAGKLQDFAETTGFTVLQLQAMEKAGAQVGVSADSVGRGLERFSVAMDDVKKGTGSAFNSILEINPTLARQFSTVKDLSGAWDLFSKAIKGTDLEQANKLARAIFGRSGVEITRLARASDDAGGLAGLVTQLKEVDRLTEAQTKRWDELGDTINEEMKLARQNIASIFTETVLSGMQRFSSGFLSVTQAMKSFALGEDFKKFLEWSKTPVGMAVLGGGAGALAGLAAAGPMGALVGGSMGGILGAARGVQYQNAPAATVNISGGTYDQAMTDKVALEARKTALANNIADQERFNAAIGAAATPFQTHTLAVNKLTLQYLENKLQIGSTTDEVKRAEDATKAYESAVGTLNAQFAEQNFATRAGPIGTAPSVAELLASAKAATNKREDNDVSKQHRLAAAA